MHSRQFTAGVLFSLLVMGSPHLLANSTCENAYKGSNPLSRFSDYLLKTADLPRAHDRFDEHATPKLFGILYRGLNTVSKIYGEQDHDEIFRAEIIAPQADFEKALIHFFTDSGIMNSEKDEQKPNFQARWKRVAGSNGYFLEVEGDEFLRERFITMMGQDLVLGPLKPDLTNKDYVALLEARKTSLLSEIYEPLVDTVNTSLGNFGSVDRDDDNNLSYNFDVSNHDLARLNSTLAQVRKAFDLKALGIKLDAPTSRIQVSARRLAGKLWSNSAPFLLTGDNRDEIARISIFIEDLLLASGAQPNQYESGR